jgi:hypothetical protein
LPSVGNCALFFNFLIPGSSPLSTVFVLLITVLLDR